MTKVRIEKDFDNYSTVDPDLHGIEIFHINNSYEDYHRHFHDTYMIGLVTGGAGHVLRRNKTDSLASPGEIALMNPGVVHSGIPDKYYGLTYKSIQVEAKMLRKASRSLVGKDVDFPELKTFVIRKNKGLFGLLSKVCASINTNMDKLEKEINFIDFVESLILNYTDNKGKKISRNEDPVIRKIKGILSDNLDDRDLSWNEISKNFELSVHHLNRKFRKETGISPWMFRKVKKIEYAKKLISLGMPLVDVAIASGFYDQSDFTKSFKHITRVSPSKYFLVQMEDGFERYKKTL